MDNINTTDAFLLSEDIQPVYYTGGIDLSDIIKNKVKKENDNTIDPRKIKYTSDGGFLRKGVSK